VAVKILGGIAKGFPIVTPKSDTTRPTSVLIKRKLFDWRQDLTGFIFVDLFAGSGAMGFEALSRGSEMVYLNEMSKPAFIGLKENKARLEKAFHIDQGKLKISNFEAKAWLQKQFLFEIPDSSRVILYFDPPYENHHLYLDGLLLLKKNQFSGELWLEADRLKGPDLDSLIGAFHSVIKKVEQGDHFVLVGKLV
jgi:16S rRNA (guanine966-N2)-methyltransferase